MSLRRRVRNFWAEIRDRRAGRKAMGNDGDFFRSARGIVGATGWSFSGAWDHLEKDGKAYNRSMQREPHLPPSLFVSEQDRVRAGLAAPLSERCIEDYKSHDAMPVRDWDISKLDD